MNLTWRSTLKVLACLVLGFALGVFFCHWKGASRFTDPEKRAEYVLNKFSDQLDLNPDQKSKVAAIMKQKHDELKAIHDEVSPRFEQIHQAAKLEIRALLNPDQQKKFDQISAEREAKRKLRQKEMDF